MDHFEWIMVLQDRIPISVAALLCVSLFGAVFGPLMGNAYPFFWGVLDSILGPLGDKMDQSKRTASDLRVRGAVFSIVLLCLFGSIGYGLQHLFLGYEYRFLVEGLLLVLCLSSGAVWFSVGKLYKVMEEGGEPQGGYYNIARTTRVNLTQSDDYGIVRVALGLCVRALDKAIIAPVFWYIVLGVPGLFLYTIVGVIVWRFAKNGFSKGFTHFISGVEFLMGIIPHIATALIVTVSAVLVPGAGFIKGVTAWMGLEGRAKYAQGGMVLSVMAWIQGISLGGAVQDLSGSALKCQWVGPKGATAQNDSGYLKRGLYISIIGHVLFLFALLVVYLGISA